MGHDTRRPSERPRTSCGGEGREEVTPAACFRWPLPEATLLEGRGNLNKKGAGWQTRTSEPGACGEAKTPGARESSKHRALNPM